MMKTKRTVSVLLAAALSLTAFTACQKKEAQTMVSGGSEVKYNGDKIYPIECEDTLTLWMPLNSIQTTMASNFGDFEIAKEIEKKTGIKVEYSHPATGMDQEQFNLMLASDDLPDIIKGNWHGYGAEKAIKEGYIAKLNDRMKDWAPNLKKLLDENAELDKQVKTDEGSYYVFPFVRGDEKLCVYGGPIVRKDWLDKLGMEVPETIDEWDTMLQRFKDELGAEIPLALNMGNLYSGVFIGAYGITDGLYVDDKGKVQYGPARPEYKEFLTKMNDWYNRGLLDKNFPSIDTKILQSYVLNDKTGATYGLAGGGIGSLLSAGANKDGFDLAGAKYPVAKKGERAKFSQWDHQYTYGSSFAISAKTKNPELAMRFLDYGYGEEGQMVYNYGVEGVSYEMIDGKPTFTDFIMKNPDGTAYTSMLSAYSVTSSSGPSVQHLAISDAQRPYQQQKDAGEVWSNTDAKKHAMPIVALTNEENDRLANIRAEIVTYKQEMQYAFIMGTEPLSKFDDYIKQLKTMGIDTMIEVYQAAVDRYNSR